MWGYVDECAMTWVHVHEHMCETKTTVWPRGCVCVYTKVGKIVYTQVCVYLARPGNGFRERHCAVHTHSHTLTCVQPVTSPPECPGPLGRDNIFARVLIQPCGVARRRFIIPAHSKHSLNLTVIFIIIFSTILQMRKQVKRPAPCHP